MKKTILTMALLCLASWGSAQDIIPLDTLNWDIQAKSYVLETYKGQEAVYLQGGSLSLKDGTFLNGTIEYDIYLKEVQSFPGVYFRVNGANAEQFYVRPHQSGNPDANQAIPLIKGITAWQLYFGERYSFPYEYHYDDWTHVKVVVNGDRAQVFLDHSETPHLSWQLFHEAKAGGISITGGNAQGMHLANIKIDKNNYELKDFQPMDRKPIEGLVPEWQLSDKFDEKLLDDPSKVDGLIKGRKWGATIAVEEGTAANISRAVQRYDDTEGNTVFAKIEVTAAKSGFKRFEFGYSDRVVVILNGTPMYSGNNRWRSRDYRYLGTVGLFDAVYLNLKKGKNTLLLAVSEDFGGWLVTGKFTAPEGLKIK
ncbi:hypothetical protein WIW50_11830 [Flavobacteriaceae bacterium 3-367]|uniref:hypothetical protein n=1 Tax=Eudoraea algarum TaxID=3417568 RepID=UPI003294E047